MAKEYDPKEIEAKWQEEWQKLGLYQAKDFSLPAQAGDKPKYYVLVEFPYPSGDGLHVGHVRSYTALDAVARKRRMEGFNVLYPIGYDAFGLPTENFAIKVAKDPRTVTRENTDTFRRQIQALGISFDWSREINTTDPKYYKWTQWLFLKFLENGLAYKARIPINWCPKDKIGLANEEVVDGCCERCGTEVEEKEMEQWMLAITKYADRLYEDLETVDYPERVKIQQRNWIGKSEGAEIDFGDIKVFTTRPDTICGASFVAVSPELSKKLTGNDFGIKRNVDRENKEKIGADTGLKVKNPVNGEMVPVWVVNYVSGDYGTGAIMGVPAHDERDWDFAKKYKLPINTVIVPQAVSHAGAFLESKQRPGTFLFQLRAKDAKILPGKLALFGGKVEQADKDLYSSLSRELQEELELTIDKSQIKGSFVYSGDISSRHVCAFHVVDVDESTLVIHEGEAIVPLTLEEAASHPDMANGTRMAISKFLVEKGEGAFTGHGILVNSGNYDGLDSQSAKEEILNSIGGTKKTTYKLRDWVFSRQRYWGEPIPVIHCEKCGMVPVPEKDLPVELPKVDNYKPTDTGESPLANISEWVNTTCPKCGGKAKRETDVMPNWAGSSWYFLRYCDDKNDKEFASKEGLKYWMSVDWYNGGMEHTVLHLLYSRFWNKFLFDLGLVLTGEPYKKRTSHGLILAEGGEKMSKSKGNVVNPDTIVKHFGADTLRLYEMFMGPFEQAIAWSEDALVGPRRFLERIWKLQDKVSGDEFAEENLMHQTIKKVSEDIENIKFNTAVSSLMVYVNALEKHDSVSKKEFEILLLLLAPFAPHLSEELWHDLEHKDSVHTQSWPVYDPLKIDSEEATMAIQINGKVRASLKVSTNDNEDEIKARALSLPEVQKWLGDKEPKKVIIVPKKIVSIVT